MLRAADGGELMRRLLGGMLQAVVDVEATAHIGALPHERTDARTTQRNGTRDKVVTTAAGDLTVKIPKVRTGSFFPALLAPRRRIDVALHAVVMQAYVEGVSTRRVDDLVIAMGGTGISKSEVSRICAQLDADVASWRTRPLDHIAFPYVFLDATYCKVRLNQRIVSQAVVIATGVSADGRREVLGCAVGDSETEAFWTEFLRELKDRGLGSVQLVISDAHSGLIKAISTTMQGASWQRCRVHFMRNALARVSKGHAEMVAATIRTIFAQPGQAEVTAVAGVKGRHDPARAAVRHGTEKGSVTLGGRRVPVSRPRARTVDGHEVPLQSYGHFAADDLLSQVVLERMLAGCRDPPACPDRRASRQSPHRSGDLDGPLRGLEAVREGDRDGPGRVARAGPDGQGHQGLDARW